MKQDTILMIELINHNKLSHDVVGKTEISLVDVLQVPSYKMLMQRFKLVCAGDSSNSTVELEISFSPVHEGLLTIFLLHYLWEVVEEDDHDAKLHIVSDTFSKDIQGKLLGRKSGTPIHLQITENNWFHEIEIRLVISGKMVAKGSISPVKHNKDEMEKEAHIELFTIGPTTSTSNNLSKPYASIKSKIRFLSSGKLCIRALNISSLFSLAKNRCDHSFQLVFSSQGISSTLIQQMEISDVDKSANHLILLNVLDHDEIKVDCYSLDAVGNKNEYVGSGHLSLLPIYTRGTYKACIQIKQEEGKTAVPLFFSFEFSGRGQKFPKLHQLASNITFNESDITSHQENLDIHTSQVIFSDEDIKATFELCDLDGNGYIGATELRHILICMGELVTEEEIDMMISMLDRNGDGQVDLNHFSMMAKSPTVNDINELQDYVTVQKADAYQEIYHMISNFVEKNNFQKETLNEFCDIFYQRRNSLYSKPDALKMDPLKRSHAIWRVGFESLKRIFEIDAIHDLKEIFQMLDPDEDQTIDARRFILGIMNFINTYSTYERTKIMIDLYDEKRSGSISSDDFLSVLAAIHCKSRESVRRKSEIVLKFVNDHLSHEDLLNVATKFPNLLFLKISTNKK